MLPFHAEGDGAPHQRPLESVASCLPYAEVLNSELTSFIEGMGYYFTRFLLAAMCLTRVLSMLTNFGPFCQMEAVCQLI